MIHSMRILKRLVALISFPIVFFLSINYFAEKKNDELNRILNANENELPSYLDPSVDYIPQDYYEGNANNNSNDEFQLREICDMENCFDYSRCFGEFKVFIYEYSSVEEGRIGNELRSELFQKILDTIIESRYLTEDASEACLFIAAVDTLDRDPLSADYVRNIGYKLRKSKHWNGGRNHIIFNLYSGTWPNYEEEDLGFDTGHAILAKASMSFANYRRNFDIAIPLFPKTHPLRGGEPGLMKNIRIPDGRNYRMTFKGKRYLHGIGSDTRNSLYHLHNDAQHLVLTTCKHGKGWAAWKDNRCDADNTLYDRYDYADLVRNSSFCLVPRGRRLGSFRFLETLQAGCIPIVLSNGWAMPFAEVIDWHKAVIRADERLLFQVPEMVRSFGESKKFHMRQQTQILWEQYFSSIEKIVFTTLEIIRDRLPMREMRDNHVWNTSPGGLVVKYRLSHSIHHYPFLRNQLDSEVQPNFTAILHSEKCVPPTRHSSAYRLMKSLSNSAYLSEIILILFCQAVSQSYKWPTFVRSPKRVLYRPTSRKFDSFPNPKTEAILSLNADGVYLSTDEIDFAAHVWRSFPERIVGYPSATHYWDSGANAWVFSKKASNEYSMVLPSAAIYHRYYSILYEEWLNPLLMKTTAQSGSQRCQDILLNFVIAHVTRRPPIKLAHRNVIPNQISKDPILDEQTCLNTFAAVFGYQPLIHSAVRLDPILYKDPVSNLRKKYKQMEIV